MKVLERFEDSMRNEELVLMEETIKENLAICKKMLNHIYKTSDVEMEEFEKITQEQVLEFFNHLETVENKKPRTYNKYVDKVRKIFNNLNMRDKIYYYNEFDKKCCIVRRKTILAETETRVFHTVDEFDGFWKLIVKYYKNRKKKRLYMPIFDLMINAGLRVGEINNLQLSDVDFEKNMINIVHPTNRTKKSRRIKISKRCIGLIKEYLEERGTEEGKLFKVQKRTIQATTSRRLQEAERQDMSCHKLRKSFGTHLKTLVPQVDDIQASRYLGHSVEIYQKTYVADNLDSQFAIAEAMSSCRRG